MKVLYHPTEAWRERDGEEDSLVFWAPKHGHGARIYLTPELAARLRELMEAERSTVIQEHYYCRTCQDWRLREEITRRENGCTVACVHCEKKQAEVPVKAPREVKEGEDE